MDKKKDKSIPCKNCGAMPNEHNHGEYDDLLCEVERLPLQIQEVYQNPHSNDMTKLRQYIVYYPMDNLQLLEHEYEKRQRETPTRESLH